MNVNLANPGIRILPADLPEAGAPGAGGEEGFGESLKQAVAAVDNLSLDARYRVSSLIQGSGADVHDAMIAVEKADLSFQLMLQVRNKVVQAYQQIASMQF
ncbi:MAG TPA: flagellar hook-basal body complex protein FliE [Candidatus Binatia bacterium]|nr:flagellar hook-basal body complex protein FliE [Candidatus Binatia bacterium]